MNMDGDSLGARLNLISKRYESAMQTLSGIPDVFLGFEEIDEDDDIREEFPCPFCPDYFDIVGLCCHIDDEHHTGAGNGVCPVCDVRVGVDMVAHITLQHGNLFKVQRKRKSRKGGSHSTLSFLRKELREGNLQSLFGTSSCLVSSSNTAPDPLLSSFMSMTDDVLNSQFHSSADTSSAKEAKEEKILERNMQSPPLSIKDQEERTRRSGFVQGLLFSTIFEDKL